MDKIEKKRFIYGGVFPLLFVFAIIIVKLIEVIFEVDFTSYGILPRTLEGVKGIFLSPFIHGDWNHLFNNAIPLMILGWAIFYFYKGIAVRVVLWSYLLAGLYTWISARTSYHIGASGLVYSFFGFLLISGFLRKHIPLIALSFLVAFLYGSLVWGILPWEKAISWEGHFWGLFVGLILAVLYRKKGPQRKEFVWAEGDEEEVRELEGNLSNTLGGEREVVYHYIPTKKEED